MDDDVDAFMKAGADAVLAKPLKPTQLDQVLSYLDLNGCVSAARTGLRLSFFEDHFTTFHAVL